MADEPKIDLKKILTRSKAEIERDKRLFAEAKARLSEFVPKTDAQHQYAMGLARQKALYPAYHELREKAATGEVSALELENYCIMRRQLAEANAAQAKFFRAAKLHTSQQISADYLSTGNAVKNRRFPHGCAKTQIVAHQFSAKGTEIPNRHAVCEIYLPQEKREVVVFKCFECGGKFADYK